MLLTLGTQGTYENVICHPEPFLAAHVDIHCYISFILPSCDATMTAPGQILKLLSMNIRGLNKPEKCSQLLHEAHRLRAHIVLLQEIHFRSDRIPKLSDHSFPYAYHVPNPASKSKGVSSFKAILICL